MGGREWREGAREGFFRERLEGPLVDEFRRWGRLRSFGVGDGSGEEESGSGGQSGGGRGGRKRRGDGTFFLFVVLIIRITINSSSCQKDPIANRGGCRRGKITIRHLHLEPPHPIPTGRLSLLLISRRNGRPASIRGRKRSMGFAGFGERGRGGRRKNALGMSLGFKRERGGGRRG